MPLRERSVRKITTQFLLDLLLLENKALDSIRSESEGNSPDRAERAKLTGVGTGEGMGFPFYAGVRSDGVAGWMYGHFSPQRRRQG